MSFATATASSRVVLPASLSGPYPAGSPLAKYVTELRDGRLRPDIRQEKAMKKLQQLWEQVEQYLPAAPVHQATAASPTASSDNDSGSSGGFFSFARRLGGIFASRSSSNASSSSSSSAPSFSPSSSAPRGLYMYGGVGCGKTRLMDLFYSCVTSPQKRREHFHHFMLDFHSHLHALRSSAKHGPNPIPVIAQQYASRYKLLCLDEFQVTDVADAMILRLLFQSLWVEGVVVVATSNRPPDDLYKNGINRDVFVPFIDELRQMCEVHAMEDGQDHRLLGTVDDGVYHYPLDSAADERLAAIWQRLTEGEVVKPEKVTVMMGRFIDVKQAGKQAALFDFDELCNRPLGAADYIALAARFQYIVIRRVPIMRSEQREIIRRFITLLDVLYERGTRLIVTAAAKPRELFVDEEGRVIQGGGGVYDEGFASGRAVSRLIEMQSAEYVKRQVGQHDDGNGDT